MSSEYSIPNVTQFNKLFLRSKTEIPTTVAQEVDETVADFLLPGFFVAIAADTSSIDIVWLFKLLKVIVLKIECYLMTAVIKFHLGLIS